MPRSLTIEKDWLDQPSASDALERRTWACLRIEAAGLSVTRLWDAGADTERTGLYIPTFPLAAWIVENWWTLLYEPIRGERLPPPDGLSQCAWYRRHCLRCADSDLLLPRAFIYGDADDVCIQWQADDVAYPHMPGRFIESGFTRVARTAVENELREFVTAVLGRAGSLHDSRVLALRDNWNAICTAEAAEAAFCQAAGRMGLDPYQCQSWDPALTQLLESEMADKVNTPLVADFLEAVNMRDAIASWHWVADTTTEFDLHPAPRRQPHPIAPRLTAAATGYALAHEVRLQAGLGEMNAVGNVGDIAGHLGVGRFIFQPRNQSPSASIKATVGWQTADHLLVVGPELREENQRFLEARGLYQGRLANSRGPRLVTSAHTWDQQTARAFAAELLAPRAAMVERMPTTDAAVEALAREYRVSTRVIEHQLENAGIDVWA